MKEAARFFRRHRDYSTVVVRVGIALVLLWFGANQLVNQESFLGYVPQWLYQHDAVMQHEHPLQFMHNIPTPSVHVALMANAIIDTVLGLLLLAGFFTRIAAVITFFHLSIIAVSLGYNDIAVRDFGLALMALSLAFSGAGKLSWDNKKP